MPKRYTYYRQKKFVWRFPKKKNPADASSSDPPPPPPPWVELPRDITANILHRLGTIDVLQTALKVCSTWRSVCLDPAMWRVIDMSSSDRLHSPALKAMCRYAVDLSQGQLVDISIEDFGTDDLVLYIAQRSGLSFSCSSSFISVYTCIVFGEIVDLIFGLWFVTIVDDYG